jgi:hypothetical protein
MPPVEIGGADFKTTKHAKVRHVKTMPAYALPLHGMHTCRVYTTILSRDLMSCTRLECRALRGLLSEKEGEQLGKGAHGTLPVKV